MNDMLYKYKWPQWLNASVLPVVFGSRQYVAFEVKQSNTQTSALMLKKENGIHSKEHYHQIGMSRQLKYFQYTVHSRSITPRRSAFWHASDIVSSPVRSMRCCSLGSVNSVSGDWVIIYPGYEDDYFNEAVHVRPRVRWVIKGLFSMLMTLAISEVITEKIVEYQQLHVWDTRSRRRTPSISISGLVGWRVTKCELEKL